MSLRQDRKLGESQQSQAGFIRKAPGCGDSSQGSKRKLRGASLLFNPLTMKGRKEAPARTRFLFLYTRQCLRTVGT